MKAQIKQPSERTEEDETQNENQRVPRTAQYETCTLQKGVNA
jgi:hypothetical protein